MKINLLDSSIYNLISAGEVVESSASVVKELVENSIDAGATDIIVSIASDGERISLIRVADNGSGMSAEDLKLSYLPHATSKIVCADDLSAISTLGFRGEALASISSVSVFSVVTKREEDETASALFIGENAKPVFSDAARSRGTTVSVEKLFYNTPARYKFLKSLRSEINNVNSKVSGLILANPTIAIEFDVNGETVYRSDGRSEESALYAVFDSKTCKKLFPLDVQSGNVRVYGYLSDVSFTKPNRTSQTLIVNGRVVNSDTVTSAVEKAYSNYLMKRCYPVFVLNLIVPFDTLDVNVHPCKAEVRFSDSGHIFGFIYKYVNLSLMESLEGTSNNTQSNEEPSATEAATDSTQQVTGAVPAKTSDFVDLRKYIPSGFADSRFSARKNYYEQEKIDFSEASSAEKTVQYSATQEISEITADVDKNDALSASKCQDAPQASVSDKGLTDFRIIGQVFSTYIAVEQGETLYLVDQHAAHERMLYDRLMSKSDGNAVQPLLVPYIEEFTAKEFAFLESILDSLREIGFDVELFGTNSLKISAVPFALSDISFKSLFENLLSDVNSQKAPSVKDILHERLCIIACRSAIKGGDALDARQLEAFVKTMLDAESAPLQCPHGRPCVVKIDKKQLEKLFKRIV